MLSGLLCGERGKRWSVLLLASKEAKRGRERLARPFMLPREVTQAEWHQSFSLDEICKFETLTAKTTTALNNDFCYNLNVHTQWYTNITYTNIHTHTHKEFYTILTFFWRYFLFFRFFQYLSFSTWWLSFIRHHETCSCRHAIKYI